MSGQGPARECLACDARTKNIFCDLEPGLVRKLSHCKTAHNYRRKQILFYEGNPVQGVYCVESGRIKLYKTDTEGRHYINRVAEAGDVLGLASTFSGEPYYATAELLEDGTICFIEKEAFLDLIERDAPLSRKVIGYLANRLRNSDNERLELARHSVRERMARLLLLLARKDGIAGAGKRIDIELHLSREEIADMIGTAPETATRLLSEFKKADLIELEGKAICLLDRQKLVDLANLF